MRRGLEGRGLLLLRGIVHDIHTHRPARDRFKQLGQLLATLIGNKTRQIALARQGGNLDAAALHAEQSQLLYPDKRRPLGCELLHGLPQLIRVKLMNNRRGRPGRSGRGR